MGPWYQVPRYCCLSPASWLPDADQGANAGLGKNVCRLAEEKVLAVSSSILLLVKRAASVCLGQKWISLRLSSDWGVGLDSKAPGREKRLRWVRHGC